MLRRRNLGTLVALAALGEILAFVAVVHLVGFGPALLLGLGTTVLGISRLRRLGADAIGRMRDVASGRNGHQDAFVDGALSAAGAVLLILPGFLSDAVGLAMLAPSCRDWLKRRIGVVASPLSGPRPSAGARTIELDAQDWSRLDRMRPH